MYLLPLRGRECGETHREAEMAFSSGLLHRCTTAQGLRLKVGNSIHLSYVGAGTQVPGSALAESWREKPALLMEHGLSNMRHRCLNCCARLLLPQPGFEPRVTMGACCALPYKSVSTSCKWAFLQHVSRQPELHSSLEATDSSQLPALSLQGPSPSHPHHSTL